MNTATDFALPGLNCGLCGYRSCQEFSEHLKTEPGAIKRCLHMSKSTQKTQPAAKSAPAAKGLLNVVDHNARPQQQAGGRSWKDSLGRDFDFYLEHFPEDPGPREIIIPHNPMITRELEIKAGDVLIGRPLGMSCGCPITHCGIVSNVDLRTGVIVWCVTGPLRPREQGYKDLGYYIAEGYEGIVRETRTELKIGMRYYFQPHMCMLQWRHSGLVNFLNRTSEGLQIRVEGLWIG